MHANIHPPERATFYNTIRQGKVSPYLRGVSPLFKLPAVVIDLSGKLLGMLHIVLFQPEIPPNTGNIMRLCANTGNPLHLIRPLGFALEDKHLRRAGLDYREWAKVSVYDDLASFCADHPSARLLAFSTKGHMRLDRAQYQINDALLFGPETRGLPLELLNSLPPAQRIRIPMRPNNRSLNLANAVAIACYEAWRQLGFCGAE